MAKVALRRAAGSTGRSVVETVVPTTAAATNWVWAGAGRRGWTAAAADLFGGAEYLQPRQPAEVGGVPGQYRHPAGGGAGGDPEIVPAAGPGHPLLPPRAPAARPSLPPH